MSNIPAPGQIYRHFKGNLYRIVTLAEHSETGEKLVVYQGLYGEYPVYARPVSMFMEKLDKEKYPDTDFEYRFELQKELIEAAVSEKREEGETKASGPEKEKTKISGQEGSEEEMKANARETSAEAAEEFHLDPLVLEFLDADTCEKRLNILSVLHDHITNDMINIMAVSTGVEIREGDTEGRYEELRSCLITLGRYESSRLR